MILLTSLVFSPSSKTYRCKQWKWSQRTRSGHSKAWFGLFKAWQSWRYCIHNNELKGTIITKTLDNIFFENITWGGCKLLPSTTDPWHESCKEPQMRYSIPNSNPPLHWNYFNDIMMSIIFLFLYTQYWAEMHQKNSMSANNAVKSQNRKGHRPQQHRLLQKVYIGGRLGG